MSTKLMSVIVMASALSLCWGGNSADAATSNGPEGIFGASWGRIETLVHPTQQSESTIFERFEFGWDASRTDFTVAMKHRGLFGDVKKAWSSRLSTDRSMSKASKVTWVQDASGTWVWHLSGVGLYLLSEKYFHAVNAGIMPEFASAADERQYLKNIELDLRWNPLDPRTLQLGIRDHEKTKVISLRRIVCEKNYCRPFAALSENELAQK